MEKLGEKKRGKTDWICEFLTCAEVAEKHWYTLCKFGVYISFNLCHGSHVKCGDLLMKALVLVADVIAS